MLQKWWTPGQFMLLNCGAAIHGAAKSQTRLSDWTTNGNSHAVVHFSLLNELLFLFKGKLFLSGTFVVVVQSLSHVQLSVIPWTAAHQASLSFTILCSLLKLMFIQSMMPSNHLILCHPLLWPSTFPTIRVFSSESALCIRWPKYWNFSFSICPSNEYSGLGLISFRIDWFDLLAVPGPLKSLLQHYSSKASILQHSDFFMV